jgi:hypothetical protein
MKNTQTINVAKKLMGANVDHNQIRRCASIVVLG